MTEFEKLEQNIRKKVYSTLEEALTEIEIALKERKISKEQYESLLALIKVKYKPKPSKSLGLGKR
ncbi:hypothetical protein [Providencia alcalifaciens]|uniref:hypothetical protein n=1 Tax=Providencia alcalifaciens TaxID=126385 RepID=UPI000D3B2BA4|nr:hypothetical protein [Providencia alcalifaciens]